MARSSISHVSLIVVGLTIFNIAAVSRSALVERVIQQEKFCGTFRCSHNHVSSEMSGRFRAYKSICTASSKFVLTFPSQSSARNANVPKLLLGVFLATWLSSTFFYLVAGLSIGTGWEKGAFWGSKLTQALTGVKNVNSNTVQFAFYMRQVGLDATKATYFSDENELLHSIRQAKAAGFKVFLKPVIDVRLEGGNYTWRGNIKGSDEWFKELYTPFIKHMATIAQKEKVDIFSVGSELRDSESHVAQWRNIIKVVRGLYHGKLTYIANHDVSRAFFSVSLLYLALSCDGTLH